MNLRETALRLLMGWELEGRYINLVISSHILDSCTKEEKALLTSLLYTTVEHKISYDYYISALAKRSTDKIDPRVLNILRLGMCQVIDLSSVPSFAAVNETVKLARNKGERSFINAVLRAAAAAYEAGTLPLPPYQKNPARHYSVKYSLPLWICKKFISELGEEGAVALFESFGEIPPTDISVNTLKTTREELLAALAEVGISAEPSKLSPVSIKITSKCSPREIFGYDEGLFFVQDEASAISVLALAPEAGDRVIDVCSAPGGKSLLSAVLMGDEGEIFAFDLRESKLSLIESSCERLGIRSVRVSACDATEPRAELFGSFDKLICDVTCSGLGVISKKSDLRYKPEEAVKQLPALQLKILTESCKYLRAGGELIYSTCTLNSDENEGVVNAFLTANEGYLPLDFSVGELHSEGGMLTLYPHIHETDGFFIAKIKKVR